MIYDDQIGMESVLPEYAAFVDKFKPKKTTDDCYTPENIYRVVLEWVRREYGIPEDAEIVRPFWPGGDFERYDYPENCVIVDNPPFSLLTKICRFYQRHGLRFFLFAPSLTGVKNVEGVCNVAASVSITYENGATVRTGFCTNMEQGTLIRSAPELYALVKKANVENTKKSKKEIPRYVYPDNVIQVARVMWYSEHGTEYRLRAEDAYSITALDEQRAQGKAIFGTGYLLSEKAAAEKAAAEKAAATKWKLSEREWEIVRRIGKITV